MKKILSTIRSSISINVIGGTILLLVVFGFIISTIGYVSFTNAFKEEYSTTTYHMADTAAALVNGDHLDAYLAGKETEEYALTKERLDSYCMKMNVSLVYVIQVDTSDYGRFVSIFNSVNNSVDYTEYVEWELGYQRDTTNNDYRQKYQALYNKTSQYENVYRMNVTGKIHPHITTLVPILTSKGDVSGLLCIQRPARELSDLRAPYLIKVVVFGILFAFFASVLAAYFIRTRIIAPVKKVSEEATRFARRNTKGKELGKISEYRELSDLATSIDTMETDMVNYIENLTSITAEKERISTELTVAANIQLNLLPHKFPPFPDHKEIDIFASMDPAKEVGGDFYDYSLIDDDHLYMVIADVSGKGIPAALVMMASKIVLENNALAGKSPAQILYDSNNVICTRNHGELFITAWVGILELSTGKLTAANAGHEYPFIGRADLGFELYKDKHGFVLGGMPNTKYVDYEIQLGAGDKVFVFTDGVTEATDNNKKLFGSDRLFKALNSDSKAAPETILKNVSNAVNEFVKEAEQFDDLTMLCIEYKGEGNNGN